MRAQGTVICALWVPQKRRAAEWCRVQKCRLHPALVPAEDVHCSSASLQLQQSGKNRGSCPVPGQVLKCSCRGTEREEPVSYSDPSWNCGSLDREGQIQQCHAERSWRYGSLRAIVRMLQCITI